MSWIDLKKHHWRKPKPELPKHRCGHERTPENTLWCGPRWGICRRCDEIARILARLA